MDIFGSNVPGTARRISVPTSISATIDVSAGSLLNDSSLLITSVGYSGDAALQLMRTLGKSIYLYSFGLRNTMVVISGISFLRTCGSSGGAMAIMNLVSEFESTVADGSPVALTIGSLSFTGILQSLRSTWLDQATGALGFSLNLHALSSKAANILAGSP